MWPIGLPSRTQPWSSATSWQSTQTSTKSSMPSGAKRSGCSPTSNVRSQIAHCLASMTRIVFIGDRNYRELQGKITSCAAAFSSSLAFLVSSMIFCAMWVGTSS